MNKEQRKFKKVMEQRKIHKDYLKRRNKMKYNTKKEDKGMLELPKSKKRQPKKIKKSDNEG